MHVIMTKNVPKLGEVGDVCEVAPGYGRNYLIPHGLAILATAGALKQVEDLKRTELRRQDRIRYDMERLAGRIRALHLSFTARVGETGRLYGAITASDIAEAIEAELDEPVDRRKILLDESIRTLGEHEVLIHLMPGVDARASVVVVADEVIVEDIGLMAEGEERAADESADVGESVEALEGSQEVSETELEGVTEDNRLDSGGAATEEPATE